MNLSDITFSSMQSALASSYTRQSASSSSATVRSPARSGGTGPVTLAPVIPIRPSGTGSSIATGMGTLIGVLAAGDLASARTAVTQIGAQVDEMDSSSALPALLSRVAATLNTGSTSVALRQVNDFLLNPEQSTGLGFTSRV